MKNIYFVIFTVMFSCNRNIKDSYCLSFPENNIHYYLNFNKAESSFVFKISGGNSRDTIAGEFQKKNNQVLLKPFQGAVSAKPVEFFTLTNSDKDFNGFANEDGLIQLDRTNGIGRLNINAVGYYDYDFILDRPGNWVLELGRFQLNEDFLNWKIKKSRLQTGKAILGECTN